MKKNQRQIDIANKYIAADLLKVHKDLEDRNPVLANEALAVHDIYSKEVRGIKDKMLDYFKRFIPPKFRVKEFEI